MTGTVTRQRYQQRTRITFQDPIKEEYVVTGIEIKAPQENGIAHGILSKRTTGFTIYFGAPVKEFEYTLVKLTPG